MAKTATGIVLNQDGTVQEFEYQDGEGSFRVLQEKVGGYIESVSYYFKNIDAYVNEEGLYTPGLTLNVHAALVLDQAWMGNIVIPRVTDSKRARLTKMGFDLVNGVQGSATGSVAVSRRVNLAEDLDSLGIVHT